MAPRTQRGRNQSYENIAVGSAVSSFERTIAGAVPPVELSGAPGGAYYDDLAVAAAPPTANTADNYVVAVVTPLQENVAVGG